MVYVVVGSLEEHLITDDVNKEILSNRATGRIE